MWFGGEQLTDAHLRRLVVHGHGFHPFGRPTAAERDRLRDAWEAVGRTEPLELVGGIRGTFHGSDDVADLGLALADVPRLRAEGWTSVCFKPNHYTDDLDDVPALCERVVAALA
jgi:hypothetical protein